MRQAHLIRRCIFMCEQKHCTYAHMSSGEAEKADLRIHLSTSCPREAPFSHNCTLPLGVCQTRSTFYRGSTCSEENTSDIDKNCLFFPPSFLVNPWPLLLHVTPGWIDGHAEMYLCRSDYLHCTQVDGWLVSKSSPAFFLHNSCFQNSSH